MAHNARQIPEPEALPMNEFLKPSRYIDFEHPLVAGKAASIWPEPLQVVVEVLESCRDYLQVSDNLPDILLIPTIRVN